MSENFKLNTFEGNLETRTTAEPQAPRSISIEQADADSDIGRNDVPYNPGTYGHENSSERPPGAR